jgi:hypothetical protein
MPLNDFARRHWRHNCPHVKCWPSFPQIYDLRYRRLLGAQGSPAAENQRMICGRGHPVLFQEYPPFVAEQIIIPEWRALGLQRDFQRPIEREFATAILKHLSPDVSLANDIDIKTQRGELHLDFVIQKPAYAVGVTIDDQKPPSPYSCVFRDLAILITGRVTMIYALQSKATAYTLDDALYLLSLSEPTLFSERSMQVLKIASRLGHTDTEIRRRDGYIEGRLNLDEWDPPSVPEHVYLRRVDSSDPAWLNELQFMQQHPRYSVEQLAANWLRRRGSKY